MIIEYETKDGHIFKAEVIFKDGDYEITFPEKIPPNILKEIDKLVGLLYRFYVQSKKRKGVKNEFRL